MTGWAVFSILLGISSPAFASSDAGFATPHPGLLEELRQQNKRHSWLRISTDSMRMEARVQSIEAHGLGGITPRRPDAPVPDPIPWSSISRIEAVNSAAGGAREGALAGAMFFGGAGAITGLILAREGDALLAGFALGVLGAGAGAVLGALGGAFHPGVELLYDRPQRPPDATPDSTASRPFPHVYEGVALLDGFLETENTYGGGRLSVGADSLTYSTELHNMRIPVERLISAGLELKPPRVAVRLLENGKSKQLKFAEPVQLMFWRTRPNRMKQVLASIQAAIQSSRQKLPAR